MERGASRWLWLGACALLACAGPVRASGCTLGKYGTLSVEMIGERPTTLVKVDGKATRFAIDTGAWFNFMSRANADALGLKLAPSGSMRSRSIASLYVAIDEPANALPLLDAWIRAHGDDASLGSALNERCWARALANQALDGALHDCRKAIKRYGDRADYLDSLGMVYLRMGNYAESIKAYRRTLSQSPHAAWSHWGLGLAELHSGQTGAGNAELATARSLDKEIAARAAKLGLVAPDGPPPVKASGVQPSR